jgi:hypothetical protein
MRKERLYGIECGVAHEYKIGQNVAGIELHRLEKIIKAECRQERAIRRTKGP